MTTTTVQAPSRFGPGLLAALAERVTAVLRASARARPAKRARRSIRSAAEEAQNVRNMAFAFEKTDPGFASDLYAAAARHEGRYDA